MGDREGGQVVLERLSDHAAAHGWIVTTEPCGNSFRAVIQHGPERAFVLVDAKGLLVVTRASPRLQAEILIWRATLPTFHGNRTL